MMEVLEHRKNEAIERTFQQVSKQFSDIFEKLVPAGKGELVMQRKTDLGEVDDSMEVDATQNSVDSYVGIAIRVCF